MSFFDTYFIRPVFNVLEFIYAYIPGHDLGISIILFTILVRIALWPLVKKQLHHAKAMRKLQPELKKIKKAAGSDRQEAAKLQMELYKERGIKPFSSILILIVQLPIFIALYQAILKITNNPNSLIDFSYQFVRDSSWIQTLAADISRFDDSLLSLVDLSRKGVEFGADNPGIYIPAIIVAVISSFAQYHQTKLTMMTSKDARKLSDILKEAASGKEADQMEVTAAVSRLLLVFLPFLTFIFAISVPSALSLYLLTSAAVGYYQTRRILGDDAEEMAEIAAEEPRKSRKKIKAEIIPPVAAAKKPADRTFKKKSGKIETTVTISTLGSGPAKQAPVRKKNTKKKRRR